MIAFKKDDQYLVDFDGSAPVTTEDLNKALWISPTVDDDFDGWDQSARDAGFVAVEVGGEQ